MARREDERLLNLREDMRFCPKHQCWYDESAGCPYCRGKNIFEQVIWPKDKGDAHE
jgi:hypothetical protein